MLLVWGANGGGTGEGRGTGGGFIPATLQGMGSCVVEKSSGERSESLSSPLVLGLQAGLVGGEWKHQGGRAGGGRGRIREGNLIIFIKIKERPSFAERLSEESTPESTHGANWTAICFSVNGPYSGATGGR